MTESPDEGEHIVLIHFRIRTPAFALSLIVLNIAIILMCSQSQSLRDMVMSLTVLWIMAPIVHYANSFGFRYFIDLAAIRSLRPCTRRDS